MPQYRALSLISALAFLMIAVIAGLAAGCADRREKTTSPAPADVKTAPSNPHALKSIDFETATLDSDGKETRRKLSAQYFAEDLGDGVALEMMKVPGGTFMMGSPSDEADYSDSEGPRHSVAVPEFFMGRFEITREQWRQIAKMPQVSIYLEEDPSSIKDSLKQPVEQVKWVEAVEVCERLKKKTGYAYRLPSEAEWEYAERAGTTTPFAFGPMITPAIVNYYNDESLHGSASKDPKKADVGSLGTANAFGLYDMPGNVWEWCLDVWHENYEGAPTDGSAWLSGGDSTLHVIRGGSWLDLGRYCRSAFRDADSAGERNSRNGFRVVCGARNK